LIEENWDSDNSILNDSTLLVPNCFRGLIFFNIYNQRGEPSWHKILLGDIIYGTSVADPGCFIPDPGSGTLTFLYRIRGVKKHWIPDLGSRILLYIKVGMKNKINFFLAFLVSGASVNSKTLKNKDS
jgi:hypothetical protein